MKESVLQTLRSCYEHHPEPVFLLDQDWKVIWSNQEISIGYLPQLLGIPETSWENCTRKLRFGEESFQCRLLCNQKDGVRIVTLEMTADSMPIIDTEIITDAVHSVSGACRDLSVMLGKIEDMDDDIESLKIIAGNCYRIYRMVYLQKEIERCQAGYWRKVCFSLNRTLAELKKRVEHITRRRVFTELHCCDASLYMQGDMDAFLIAVLSAIVICYTEPNQLQDLDLRLEAQDEKAIVTVSMTPRSEERRDQERLYDFGSLDGEQRLLDQFCKVHHGRWIKGKTDDTTFCRIELPTSEQSMDIELNSPMDRSESVYYNKYHLLLARIVYHDFC